MSRTPSLFNCLIRTHHITSRKKLSRVRRAAQQLNVDWLYVRSGGSPGIMFAEGRDEAGLTEWVSTVQALRYKDFKCVAKPARAEGVGSKTGFDETESDMREEKSCWTIEGGERRVVRAALRIVKEAKMLNPVHNKAVIVDIILDFIDITSATLKHTP
ncbi:hypothetical protein FACUT_4709 [Fusarium acutatum]|uniref:Uncharacterized protein n=1 Tax=Fusarium acutatum TaxID=78861 RepID=A0A8H4JXC4_9HYPO|nr:hypothetical protein FACUT_4709 [Fusarium acutatum]